jgi:hypothetical protein
MDESGAPPGVISGLLRARSPAGPDTALQMASHRHHTQRLSRILFFLFNYEQ